MKTLNKDEQLHIHGGAYVYYHNCRNFDTPTKAMTYIGTSLATLLACNRGYNAKQNFMISLIGGLSGALLGVAIEACIETL